jgi:hypothetical protein
MAVVLAFASSSACDKIPGFGGDEQTQADNQAQPTEPATPAAEPVVEPADKSPASPNAEPASGAVEQPPTPQPEPEQPPAAPVSEFDALLVRVSGLADPRHATEPTVEQDNKTAWTHYKAKQWSEAAMYFARVAARDPEWKHAHNLACASAKAGQLDDARIALTESFERGGEAAKASAKKDSDLASARELPWFAELLAGPTAPDPTPRPSHREDEMTEEEELDEDEIPPPNCPPGVKFEDQHYCWHDTLAEWKFEEVLFSTPVVLDLEIPARPKDQRWKQARGKIPWKELRAALGIQHTIESEYLTEMPHLVEWSSMVWEEEEAMAYFWWPEDNTPILVLPNKQKLGRQRFMGVILARKTDAGWQAINLPVTKESQLEGGGNYTFESGVVLRFDGLELFTLTQSVYRDDDPAIIDERSRFLCRIRWEQNKLARACTESWKETGKSWG